MRIGTQTGNGYFSDEDSVLTQLRVNQRFGESALRPIALARIIMDPSRVGANVVTRRAPQLGTATCHRKVMPAVVAAMTKITDRRLGASYVQPTSSRGRMLAFRHRARRVRVPAVSAQQVCPGRSPSGTARR